MANNNNNATAATPAEVKQYTLCFRGESLTIADLSGDMGDPYVMATWDNAARRFTVDDDQRVLVPLTAKIINGTSAEQRIGNKISVTNILMRMYTTNAANRAVPLQVTLVYDSGWNGSASVNPFDLWDIPATGLSGDICNSMTNIDTVSRFKMLKTSVIQPIVESQDSKTFLAWDFTTAIEIRYRSTQNDEDAADMTSQNSSLYMLFSTADTTTFYGSVSVLYTDA